MKILVIGGSYFFGRVFSLFASDRDDVELFVLNRGNYPLNLEGVTEYMADRHNHKALHALPEQEYDVIVDFCGYTPGDVETLFTQLPGHFRQYVFISTVDVYKHGTGVLMDETAVYEDAPLSGDIGEYIRGKILLEKELIKCCKDHDIPYTILRPAILYGPFNYAPRESVYIENIIKGNVLPCPYDATGQFQLVYVKDAALMTLALCGNPSAYNEAFNLCSDSMVTYDLFFAALKAASDLPVNLNSLSVKDAMELNIFLPFPTTADESERYDGKKLMNLTGMAYTSLADGMARTFAAFSNVYSDNVSR